MKTILTPMLYATIVFIAALGYTATNAIPYFTILALIAIYLVALLDNTTHHLQRQLTHEKSEHVKYKAAYSKQALLDHLHKDK